MQVAPATLAAHQIHVLRSHLAGVHDGVPEDVHQARVATRRLRVLLPLVACETHQSLEQVHEFVRAAGRALGLVRDLDILIALSDRLMDLHPTIAMALAVNRVELCDERDRAARRLIKRLDRVDVHALQNEIRPRGWARVRGPGNWRRTMIDRIEARSNKLERSVEHASGIYFPNRLHRVRIHLKKLRYLVEVAEQTNLWHPPHFRHDAARLQDVLGDIHDRQVLFDRLARSGSHAELRSTLRADILSRHADYLHQRDHLRGMVAASHRFAHRGRHWGRGIASGAAIAMLLPVGVALLGGHPDTVGADPAAPVRRRRTSACG